MKLSIHFITLVVQDFMYSMSTLYSPFPSPLETARVMYVTTNKLRSCFDTQLAGFTIVQKKTLTH